MLTVCGISFSATSGYVDYDGYYGCQKYGLAVGFQVSEIAHSPTGQVFLAEFGPSRDGEADDAEQYGRADSCYPVMRTLAQSPVAQDREGEEHYEMDNLVGWNAEV
ncbi:MAG: hypothetical protein HUJ73_04070 [Eubacterium sp.]|nr:hypothetical protein [Eubacterium sp.]